MGLRQAPVYYKRLAPALLGVCLLSMPVLSAHAGSFGTGGKDARSLRSMAFEHYLDKDVDTAFDYYDQAVEAALREYGQSSTYVADLYYEEGTFALQSSHFRKAEECLKEAVKQNPNSVMAHVKLAEILQLRERPDLAFEQIQAALAKNNRSPEARRALILWLLGQKNSADAIRESYVLEQSTVPNTARDAESRVALVAPSPAPKEEPSKEDQAKEEKKPLAALPVFPFLRAAPKPPAPTVKPVPVKPAAPAPKPKPSPPPRHQQPKHKEQHERPKPVHKPLIAPIPVVAAAKPPAKELHATAGLLKTTAEIKKAKPERTENETRASEPAPSTAASIPAAEPVKRHGKAPRTSLVPPPPPTPIFIAPPPMVAPPQQPRPAPKKEKPKEPVEEKPAASSTASSSNNDDDYLLKWAGVKNKKKP